MGFDMVREGCRNWSKIFQEQVEVIWVKKKGKYSRSSMYEDPVAGGNMKHLHVI